LLPVERWIYFGETMSQLTKIYDQKVYFPTQPIESNYVIETEGLVYTPIELFLKNFGNVVVDRVFVIVLSITSFALGVLTGLWVF
jgi:hypothetical protein